MHLGHGGNCRLDVGVPVMKTLSFALVLLAGAALAQPVVTRGGALKRRQYQTYGTTTYFVNGDVGSDSNPCTATDGGECATIQGAISKLPRFIQNPVTIRVAGASDGGVKDYAGFSYGGLTAALTTGTSNGTMTVTGTMGVAQNITGVTSGAYTFDAGGIRLDGGVPAFDYGEFTTVTVSSAGWTPDQLKDRFIAFIRSDGGTLATVPIYTNTSDTIIPAYQVSASTAASAPTIQLRQPLTRITSAGPNASTLVRHSGQTTLTVSNFDIVTGAGASAMTMVQNNSALTLNTSRIFWGNPSNDTMSIPAFATVTVNNSYMQGGNRYFVTSAGERSSFVIANSKVEGTGCGTGLFVRMSSQASTSSEDMASLFRATNTTFRNMAGFSTVNCAAHWVVANNRFICTGDGIYVVCGLPTFLLHQANYYQDLTSDAISLLGPVTARSNVNSGLNIGSDCKNVAGYGIKLVNGAKASYFVDYIYASTWGYPPTGALGDIAMQSCTSYYDQCGPVETYSRQFLSTLPKPQCISTASTVGGSSTVCLYENF